MLFDSHKNFGKIPNKILEAIAFGNFNDSEKKLLSAYIRETLGWNRWERKIPRGRLTYLTGMSRSHVSDVKKSLKEKQIIYQNGNKIGLQRESTIWEMFTVEGTFKSSLQREQGLPVEGTIPLNCSLQRDPTKESLKERFKERVLLTKEEKENNEVGLKLFSSTIGYSPRKKR